MPAYIFYADAEFVPGYGHTFEETLAMARESADDAAEAPPAPARS
jgi:hypothetical protein